MLYYFLSFILVVSINLLGCICGDRSSDERKTPVRLISTGPSHSCVVMPDKTIKCWGTNGYGQLGNGKYSKQSLPVTVSGINNAVSVTVGDGHSCALLEDKTIKCWGKNKDGQLGDGTFKNSNLPVSVDGIDNAIDVSAG